MPTKSDMSKFIFTSKYAKHLKDESRRESFEEAVDRGRRMMLEKFPQAAEQIEWAYDKVANKEILGSQRNLQYAGDPILKRNSRGFNCLEKSTRFITSKGVKSFEDFQDGDRIVVLTKSGEWQKATVRCYGQDDLYKVSFTRFTNNFEIWATKDHRWYLKNDEVVSTENLTPKTQICNPPEIFSEFDYFESEPDERMYWAYGMIVGDGTLVRDGNGLHRSSMIRLCSRKKRFLERFIELGFSYSSPPSTNGDPIVYTGSYLKELPDLNRTPIRLIRAFCRGLLDADGYVNRNNNSDANPFASIQSSNPDVIRFIRKAFPICGLYITSEKDLTGQETNYSIRGETSYFKVTCSFGASYNCHFTVKDVDWDNPVRDSVWCLEVDGDDKSFVLANGLVTGNCISSYADRTRFFQEAFWLLLCGCGVGFSVQKHHVADLPAMKTRENPRRIHHVVGNSIEGWADSAGVLVDSFLTDAADVEFDYSQIDPEGTPLNSGGKCPGPEPLKTAHEKIRKLLATLVEQGTSRLRPIHVFDIVMHLADAVLSGGVRRSATIAIFSADDEEMLSAKTGNWYVENPQRARANISALRLRSETDYDEYKAAFQHTKQFGEPGVYWADSTEIVPNPCQPAWAKVLTPQGIRTIGEIEVGHTIWSREGWTKVVRKWSTGINDVYSYQTPSGVFYGTEGHRVVQNGRRVHARNARSIDPLRGTSDHVRSDSLKGELRFWFSNYGKMSDGRLCGYHSIPYLRDLQTKLSAIGVSSWIDSQRVVPALYIDEDLRLFQELVGLNEFDENDSELPAPKSPLDNTIDSVDFVSSEETFDLTVDNESHTYWTQGLDVSNCVEVGFNPTIIIDGVKFSGWQACNLSSVYVSTCESAEDFWERCRAAGIIGTCQAAFTDFPYLGPVSEAIIRREALLGVSMTGVMDKPEIGLDEATLEQGVVEIRKANQEMARLLGINPAARLTALKPEGTGSLVLGTLASGRHAWPFKKGIRHIQANKAESVLNFFKKYNPHAVEHSAWSTNGVDDVVAFPVSAPEGAVFEGDTSALESLEQVKFLQRHWVDPGKNPELCTAQWLDNSVSNTIRVKPEEWDEVDKMIYRDREFFTGVSLIGTSGDKDYRQAPYVEVLEREEIIEKYGANMMSRAEAVIKSVRGVYRDLWDFFDVLLADPEKKELLGFETSKFVYCIKDVYYLERYDALLKDWKEVPYELMVETEDGTSHSAEAACAGGACLI